MPGEKTVGKNFGGDSNLGLYDRPPLASDYTFPIGFKWIDTSSDPRILYVCVKNDAGGAQWSSGGAEHSKGWFPTEADLLAAVPVGEAGDWAIIGSTDTVWTWDTDTNAWIDSGTGSIINWGGIGGILADQTDLKNALDGKLGVTGSTVISSDTTINGVNGAAYISDSASSLVHTLVSVVGREGYTYSLSNINTGAVKIQGDGVEEINGYSSITIYKGESITVRAYSGGWVIL